MNDQEEVWKKHRRGQHVRAHRKFGAFDHHGIVIAETDLDRIVPIMRPKEIEPLLVAEQNVGGLRIVTFKEFCTDHLWKPFVYKLNVVQYSSTSEKLHLARPGACRQRRSLSDDEIVENVIDILNNAQQRAIWKSYSLCIRNCEQFAVLCCTSVPSLGCQIPACIEGLKCVFLTGTAAGIRRLYDFLVDLAKNAIRVGEKLKPSAIVNGTVMSLDDLVMTSLKGNAIAAAVSFAIEAVILTVRVLIYQFSSEENREKYLACKWAISWSDYAKRMTQAGLANLAAFGGSVLGICVSAAFGGVGIIPLSILFGFIGYIGARWLSGIVYDKVRDKICGKGYGQMNKKISKLGIQMNNIRHNNAVLSIDTDIRYLQIKACSLQKLTSTTIQRIRQVIYGAVEEQLLLEESAEFIQRNLEHLYGRLNELSDQHDLAIENLEKITFDSLDEHKTLWDMMDDAGLSLFKLRFRIEDLAERMQSTFTLKEETKRNEIFENILDCCDRLDHITNDLISESE